MERLPSPPGLHAGAGGVDISVVVPVYNSAQSLAAVVERLVRVLRSLNCTFEMIFVDDGSRDASFGVLADLRDRYPQPIVAIQLERNVGQHNALMCGLRHARGRYITTMDDDLQNPPEEIPKLLDKIVRDRLDLVYGSYGCQRQQPWRNLGSRTVLLVYRIAFNTALSPTSFRIMRRELAESVLSYTLDFTYLDGLLAWNTRRIGAVQTDHHPRRTGRSGYSIGKLMRLALNLLASVFVWPPQLVAATGAHLRMNRRAQYTERVVLDTKDTTGPHGRSELP